MGNKQLRVGQAIAPFGPGSLYTDRRGIPHVVCGLDHWFKRYDPSHGMVDCEDREEFAKFEPRLSELLRVAQFFSPPDHRARRRNTEPPPNAGLQLPALRFPSWYRHTSTGQLHKFGVEQAKVPAPQGGGRWRPVRFVSVCAGGHLAEFPWREWIGCQCAAGGDLYLHDRGGSELSSIRVECRTCPPGSIGRRGKSLSGTTMKPDPVHGEHSAFHDAGIHCGGERIWLGDGASEPNCQFELVGALINQTNLYFPRTISAIRLPDIQLGNPAVLLLRAEIEKHPAICGVAKSLWNMKEEATAVQMALGKLTSLGLAADEALTKMALESLFKGGAQLASGFESPISPESELLAFRRLEYNILRVEVNDPKLVPKLRVIPTEVAATLHGLVSRVNLVERLCETRAFYGFDRLETQNPPLASMPGPAMQQLFLTPPTDPMATWLPAIEVYGEGIYLEVDERAIVAWQSTNRDWIRNRVSDSFLVRLAAVNQVLPPLGAATIAWASRYLLVHSFAHALINQLVFECGYSSAALRERLFVSADAGAPMAGILIYTAAGDSEGTMGGLVRLGRPERLGGVVARALSRVSWCSADPVCSEHLGGHGSKLANLAACHACVLLPETSCETINHGLDRAMVIGTPIARGNGFFSRLIEGPSYSLG
jgi:hypothetical protein